MDGARQIITRGEARALGLKRFYTGEPCDHGHFAERYANDPRQRCVECTGKLWLDGMAWRKESFAKRREYWGERLTTRAEAVALGLDRYFTGRPCRNGHIDHRATSNGGCFACSAIQCAKRRARPGEKEKRIAASRRSFRGGVEEHELPPPSVPGHCDLCRKPAKLFWDHDHTLEELGYTPLETHRGWLCFHCNTGLGKLGDDIPGLRKAVVYLEHCGGCSTQNSC